MPWFFSIPEFLKKRACRYLLQHYLGQFLEEKIDLDDLTVDLYNGTGSIHNIPLNVQAINDALRGVGVPIQVVSGFIECVTVSVPWAALLKESCMVELSGLTVCVAPHHLLKMEDYMSMTDSLFFSMTSSKQMAEEVLRGGGPGEDQTTGFEGMETLAQAIELVLTRVQISLTDAVFQVNHISPDVAKPSNHFLQLRIKRIEYYDEITQVESSVDGDGVTGQQPPQLAADFAVKVLQLHNLSLELGSSLCSGNMEESAPQGSPAGIPVAVAVGTLTVKITIRQAEVESGPPRVEVDGFLGTVHVLLSPQQLHLLQEIIESLAAQADVGAGAEFSHLTGGQSRPISHGDRTTIETQLARQQQEQAVHHVGGKRKGRGQDLLDADPWENSIPQTTPLKPAAQSPGVDDFYSLDLTSSLTSSAMSGRTDMEDSFVSTASRLPVSKGMELRGRGVGGATVHRRQLEGDGLDALHEGVGLQQLSQTPPLHEGVGLQQLHELSRSPAYSKHSVPRSSPSLPHKTPQLKSTHPSCTCTLTLSGITLALLEADPSHTYTSGGTPGEACSAEASMDEGGLDASKYFELVSQLLKDGVNHHQLTLHQEQLAQVLPADHLMVWVSVVRASVCVEDDRRWQGELTLGYGEMWEYLYHNHTRINHIVKPVSVSPILQLHGNHTLTPPRPGLKLKVQSGPVPSSKKSQAGCIQTDIEAFLSELHVNFDLTLIDRMQLLLSHSASSGPGSKTSSLQPEKVKHSLYMTSSNVHTIHQQRQAVFNQAVAPPTAAQSRKHRLHIKINGDVIHASLRFPVPEIGQTQHPPWFKSSLRTETLFMELTEWGVSSQMYSLALSGEAPCRLDVHFSLIQAFLSLDGSVEERELFLTISKKPQAPSAASVETAPTIRLIVQPEQVSSGLEQKPQPLQYSQMLGLLEESVTGVIKTDPQPFSQRKSMFSASDMSSKGAGAKQEEGVHSEELVLPGTVEEMKEFADFASSMTRYHLDCFFPEVRIHLPSKRFLETLYNRVGTDLALWEPATPTAVSKANAKSVMYSCMDLLQPAATNEERFLMCRSILQEELSDDEEERSPTSDTPPERQGCGYGFLAVSLQIEQGVMSIFPEVVEECPSQRCSPPPPSAPGGVGVEDSAIFHSASSEHLTPTLVQLASPGGVGKGEGQAVRGVAIMELASLHAFFVSGMEGDTAACAWVESLALYHHGNPGCGTTGYAQYSSVSETFDLSVCGRLLPVFGPAPTLSSQSPTEQPILSVAMEMRVDKDLSTKTSKVAVCVSDALMSYHFSPPGLGAIQQVAEFLDLEEELVVGHEAPSLVTELHAHVVTSSVEYRPLYLPLVASLVLDSVSLSTSVVTGAPVHVVRVVLDGLHLLLTPSRPEGSPSFPSPSSVSVLDVDWLELTLRHCDNSQLDNAFQRMFSKMPDFSLECASNVLHVRTCADSCIALSDLLLYLSSQRDLAPPPSPATMTRDYCSLPTSDTSAPHSESAQSGSPHSKQQQQQQQQQCSDGSEEGGDIGDLITAAMEDSGPSSPVGSRGNNVGLVRQTRPQKMEIRRSGESLLMDFDSDSDNEGAGARSKVSKTSAAVPPPNLGGGARAGGNGGRVLGSSSGSIFSESDEDDFCIVNTPTSTKVAPGAEPKVKCLLAEGETLDIVEDHFTIPDGMMDQLYRPRSYPEPKTQYTLKDMTVVWHLYGGRDFAFTGGSAGKGRQPVSRELRPIRHSPLRYWGTRKDVCGSSLKTGGGVGRDHSVLVEVELDKVRIQHETYPSDSEQSSRLVLLVGDVEMRDRLSGSNINKLLYQYTTEAMPKQTHASMVTLKVVFTQPELPHQQDLEEASVYLSVLPIRLNMDQDTVLFLYEFAGMVTATSQLPSLPGAVEPVRSQSEEPSAPCSGRGQPLPQGKAEPPSKSRLIFIKSFVFQPDLPIRIDYEAKGFKTEIGTVAGILFGLSHLNNSEVSLKALHYKKGLLGWDKLVEYSTNEWLNDIKGYQLPLLLKGVGPMYNVTQLVYGVMDFVRLPYQQYQEDGRLVWGIQRGTTALTSSTGVAVVELTSQLLETIQGLAQMAYDMVSPPRETRQVQQGGHHQYKPYQPLDFREGFSNAYEVVYDGIGGTAVDLYSVASKEHNERGVAGAVGGVLRHLPGTFVKPIILASEATRHVLGGVKNQFVPDARKEATEKWKTNELFEESRTL